MFNLTQKEFQMLLRCNDALNCMVEHGAWERRDGELVFVIPEYAADRILRLIDKNEALDD